MTDPVDCRPAAADPHPGDDDNADADLAARFARGERGAFEAVVERHQERVRRLAFRLLGWSADAEDVVQEVFLAALRAAPRFGGRSNLATWLTTITLNKCRSHRRGLLARLRTLTGFASQSRGGEAPPADLSAAEADALAQVRSALLRLSPREREVIVLHYLEQTPVDVMAGLLNVTRGAVEVRLHRARARLRTVLGVGSEEAT